MPSEGDWTNEQVIELINEYKIKPVLWDPKHELYRVQTAKYEAWWELAEKFDCEITDLRKKLNSIFASHRREKAKIRTGARSTWFLYPYMSFLPSHIENGIGDTTPTIQKAQESEEDDEQPEAYEEYLEEEMEQSHIIVKQEPREPKIAKEKLSFLHQKPRLKRIKRRVIKEREIPREKKRLVETVKVIKQSDSPKKKDECDSFGEYIASSLRKHDERTRSMIKQAINNILFEQEMKKYNTTQYIEITEENPLIVGDIGDDE